MSLRLTIPQDDWVEPLNNAFWGQLATAPATNLKTDPPKDLWASNTNAAAGFIQFDVNQNRALDTFALLFANVDYRRLWWLTLYDGGSAVLYNSPISHVGSGGELLPGGDFESGVPAGWNIGGTVAVTATGFGVRGSGLLTPAGANGVFYTALFPIDNRKKIKADMFVRSGSGGSIASGTLKAELFFYAGPLPASYLGSGLNQLIGTWNPNTVYTMGGLDAVPPPGAKYAAINWTVAGETGGGQWLIDEVHARQPDGLPGPRRHIYTRVDPALSTVRYVRFSFQDSVVFGIQAGRAVIGLSQLLREKRGGQRQLMPVRQEIAADDGTPVLWTGEGRRAASWEIQFPSRDAADDALSDIALSSDCVLLAHDDNPAAPDLLRMQRRLYYGYADVSMTDTWSNFVTAQLAMRGLT